MVDEDGFMRAHRVTVSKERIVLEVDSLEVSVDEVDNSVVIRDIGGNDDSTVLRVKSQRSGSGGGVLSHVGYAEKRVDDSTQFLIEGYHPKTGNLNTNRAFLGRSGFWYQHGNCESKIRKE